MLTAAQARALAEQAHKRRQARQRASARLLGVTVQPVQPTAEQGVRRLLDLRLKAATFEADEE